MEWVYDNQQKKENESLELVIILKLITLNMALKNTF